MSHTPGPWRVDKGHQTGLVRGISGPMGKCVVRFHGIAAPTSNEGQANARLMAAAPDLLAALKLAECVYRKNCVAVGEPSSVLAAMQAAITKAEGA